MIKMTMLRTSNTKDQVWVSTIRLTIFQVKAEREEYFRQLENEGRVQETYGSDVVWIVPEPLFVIKSMEAMSQRRHYINLCKSDKVTHPLGGIVHLVCDSIHCVICMRALVLTQLDTVGDRDGQFVGLNQQGERG